MSADLSAELVTTLHGLGRDSTEVLFHTHKDHPTKVWLQHGTDLQETVAPPPLRVHGLLGYDDLVTALRDKDIAPAPEVYIAGNQVVAFLDRNERRSRVTVNLVESKRLQLCRGFETQPKTMQPRDAVKMLRLDLHGGKHDHVIQALGRLDFVRNGTGRSHVDHGKESLGRSVEQEVQQAENVPKDFIVGVPVWTNNGFNRYSVNVTFGVYIDLDNQAVELRVLSDECVRLVNLALNALAADLRESLPTVPVFLGTP